MSVERPDNPQNPTVETVEAAKTLPRPGEPGAPEAKDSFAHMGTPEERFDKLWDLLQGTDPETEDLSAEMEAAGLTLEPSELENREIDQWSLLQTIPVSLLLEKGKTNPEQLQAIFINDAGVVDFRGHDAARRKIGVGDMYPHAEEYISVDGEIGKRSIYSSWGKPGYLAPNGSYLEILGGETIAVPTAVDPAQFASVESYSSAQDLSAASLFATRQKKAEQYEVYHQADESEINNGENLSGMELANSPAFAQKLTEVSARIGVSSADLLTVMQKESRINPKAVNPSTGATGLIQFMPRTAIGLGTSVGELRLMTSVEQLDYVEKYFEPFKGRLNSVEDLYMATFYPYALSQPDHFTIGSERSDKYARLVATQNPAISRGATHITKEAFYDYVNA